MDKVPTHFRIEQDEGGTAVEEITADEYTKKYAVMVMERALQQRRDVFSFPDGNVVDLIMEQFIRDRIPVQSVEKIVVSCELRAPFVMYAGIEVSVNLTARAFQYWIFDGIIPIEFGETTQGKYEIYMV